MYYILYNIYLHAVTLFMHGISNNIYSNASIYTESTFDPGFCSTWVALCLTDRISKISVPRKAQQVMATEM